MFETYREILNNLEDNSHLRTIRYFEKKDEKYIWFKDKKLLNLSSNNYLGFADNREITKRFMDETGWDCSFGSASARLLTGNLPVYNELENLISDLFQTESTLLFNSGYHANVGIISAIAESGDVIFSDKLNHASIIDGMQLSKGKFYRYKHNDMENLEELLIRERNNFKNAIIISESVFSMDGDIADLKKLIELKEKYNCILVIDEAHSFGVFGRKALGVAEDLGLINNVDLIMATFGKAIGSTGAFVTGKKVLIDYLINKSRPFIFSTSLPPVNIAFSRWIIENELPKTYEKRQKMLVLGKKLGSQSHIIPVIVGDNKETLDLCERLLDKGYFTLPVRPPTVPTGSSRIRISLTVEITEKDLEGLNYAVSLVK